MADEQNFVQAQPFNLAGAGAIIGDATIILTSMTGIDGALLTMADFGDKGFGTLEPGSGTQEEQIVFTGITQNANGTATLTGVSNVLFTAPYTETSGLAKTHAGGVQFVISNTSGFYNRLTSKSDDETITGKWTFPGDDVNRPTLSSDVDSVTNTDLVTIGQLTRTAIASAVAATTTQVGYSKLSVTSSTPTAPVVVETTDGRIPTQGENDALVGNNASIAVGTNNKFATQTGLQNGAETYVASTGSANAYVVAYTPIPTAYATGQRFTFKANFSNTSTVTVNVNSLGAKAVKKLDGATALVANDIINGQIVLIEYDGTNFQMLSPTGTLPNVAPTSFNNAFTHDISLTTTTTIAHGLGRTPTDVHLISLMPTNGGGVGFTQSNGSYNGTTQNCIYAAPNSASNIAIVNAVSGKIVHIPLGTNPTDTAFLEGACSVDATNITITWTKTGSPTGTANLIVDAQ